jgi:hypothetical protein
MKNLFKSHNFLLCEKPQKHIVPFSTVVFYRNEKETAFDKQR